MEKSARLFKCTLCLRQVVICSQCDRGNIYCGQYCAQQARMESIREANQRYRMTFQGRLNHAACQQRYRQRQKQKVTDQGSVITTPDDLLFRETDKRIVKVKILVAKQNDLTICHFCGSQCSNSVRWNFLEWRSPPRPPDWPFFTAT